MITSAYIRLWGERVGAVAWDEEQQLASFEFLPAFLKSQIDIAPIQMPVSQGQRIYAFPELRVARGMAYDTFRGLPGLLADSLPDRYGNQLMNVWLARNGRAENSMNPVEQLCFIGERGMGALEFEPSQLKASKRSSAIELDTLVEVAHRLLNDREQFETDLSADEQAALNQILKIGTSAGGARPKALIAYNEKTGAVRSGQTHAPNGYEHWLLKLDGVSDAQFGSSTGYGRVEMAYYHMATDAGIDMMKSRLLEENGRAHFMTKRFDRATHDVKHHVQTFCAMRHFDYNLMGAFSYEQLFETMRMLGLNYPEYTQLFRRMVFNVILRNCDDHTKNFAFILRQGESWRLAPAYDICHAYRPGSLWVSQHALSINGKRKDFQREDLLHVAQQMNIKKADSIIDEVMAIAKDWPRYAKTVGMEKERWEAIGETFLRV